MTNRNQEYLNTKGFGLWSVTTEGDVEGRTVTHLGTHQGWLDEIALKLAPRAYYSLRFKLVPEDRKLENVNKQATSISVLLDIDSGTWDLSREERIAFLSKMLEGRDVMIGDGQYFSCVKILDGSDPEALRKNQEIVERNAALSKLTERERSLLGLS